MSWHDDIRQLPPGLTVAAIADTAAQIGVLTEAGQVEAFAAAEATAEALVETGLIDASDFATAAVRVHLRLLAMVAGRRMSGLLG
jgi:hypothetical protein